MPTIQCPINRTLGENHDVLSQGSCFVGEQILDLAQFFIKAGRTGPCWDIPWCIIHFPIPVDIETVTQSYYLNAKIKGRKKV